MLSLVRSIDSRNRLFNNNCCPFVGLVNSLRGLAFCYSSGRKIARKIARKKAEKMAEKITRSNYKILLLSRFKNLVTNKQLPAKLLRKDNVLRLLRANFISKRRRLSSPSRRVKVMFRRTWLSRYWNFLGFSLNRRIGGKKKNIFWTKLRLSFDRVKSRSVFYSYPISSLDVSETLCFWRGGSRCRSQLADPWMGRLVSVYGLIRKSNKLSFNLNRVTFGRVMCEGFSYFGLLVLLVRDLGWFLGFWRFVLDCHLTKENILFKKYEMFFYSFYYLLNKQ